LLSLVQRQLLLNHANLIEWLFTTTGSAPLTSGATETASQSCLRCGGYPTITFQSKQTSQKPAAGTRG